MATNLRTPVLELIDLRKTYGERSVVSRLSLTVEAGEFLSIIGPSGSGKSTILKMIVGAVPPTSGRILLRGRDVVTLPRERLGIVMVWQSLALFPHMTVADNVGFGLAMRDFTAKQRRQRLEHYLELVDLAGFGQRRIHELSGGEQQRTALARALIVEPEVLLLDEPMGGLDKHRRAHLLAKFREIHRSTGVTFVMVTHDQAEAMTTSSRVAVLNRGEIEQLAPPGELSRHPRTAFVARFVGHKNVFPATVKSVNETRVTVSTAAGLMLAERPAWSDVPVTPGMKVAYVVDAFRLTVGPVGENRVMGRLDVNSVSGGAEVIEILASGVGTVRCERPFAEAEGEPLSKEVMLSWSTNDAYVLPDNQPIET